MHTYLIRNTKTLELTYLSTPTPLEIGIVIGWHKDGGYKNNVHYWLIVKEV